MPFGLYEIHTPHRGTQPQSEDFVVDIVAVHGLGEDSIQAWTHQGSGTLWLKDLVPEYIENARVLSFGYDATPSLFVGPEFLDTVQGHATTLVAELEGERSLNGFSSRPIIFIGHGLGGIIVKSALMHSANRTSRFTSHLNSIFVSTFAVMLFGTPHDNIDVGKWLSRPLPLGIRSRLRRPHDPDLATSRHSLHTITEGFAPLMKKFYIFLFWEGLKTEFEHGSKFMVEPISAAPQIHDAERCGVQESNHADMIKFHRSNPSYRTVIAALRKYCIWAPKLIASRLQEAQEFISLMREREASELTGISLKLPDKGRLFMGAIEEDTKSDWTSEHFHPPGPVSLDFLGQKEVFQQLQKAFQPEYRALRGESQKRFVLHGVSGSGKTQIAAKYAEDNEQNYWAIFTINASTSETAKEGFCEIARIGGLALTEDSGKHFLSRSKKPWLLILDNADDPDMIFETLMPTSQAGHILVTTQNPNLRKKANVGSRELQGLRKSDALQLLLKVACIHRPWDESTESAGNAIVEMFGYMAFAVCVAGNQIYKNVCSLQEYIVSWNNARAQLSEQLAYIDGKTDTKDNVYLALDLTLRKIVSRNSTRSQDAITLLKLVSFFNFDHIRVGIFEKAIQIRTHATADQAVTSFQARIFRALLNRLGPPAALPRFLREGGNSILNVKKALLELYEFSLITYSTNSTSFSLHPLVHSWANDRIPTNEKPVWATIALNTLMAAIPIPSEAGMVMDHELQRNLVYHLNTCLDQCPDGVKKFAELEFGFFRRITLYIQPTFVLLLQDQIKAAIKAGAIFGATGNFPQSLFYLLRAKEAMVKLLGPANPKTSFLMMKLSEMYWGLGKLSEAKDLQLQIISSREAILGADHPDTLRAKDALGQTYWLNGEYVEALELQKATAKKLQEKLGDDDKDTIDSLDHLGVTLSSWHRFEESERIHRKVLAAREKARETDMTKILETKMSLSMALLDQAKFEESKSLMEEVYRKRIEILGKEHPWTLWARLYLAKVYIDIGLLQESEEMLIDGVEAAKRSLGDENHLGILIGRGELSRVYARQGQVDKALELLLPTLDKLERHRGSDHPDYSYGLWKLGQLRELRKEWSEARDAYRLALEAVERRLTADHPRYRIYHDRLLSLPSHNT